MRKRLCAYLTLLLLSGCFILPAKAGSRYSTTINAICQLPEIVVTVPATAEVFINPYKMPVAVGSSETPAQIVSTPAAIENKSKVPLRVTATINSIIDPEANMRLSSSSTQGANSGKYAFIYFEMHAVSDPDQVAWDSEFNREKHILVLGGESRPQDMIILDQADKPNHFGAFRITGDCTLDPRIPWTEHDKLDVSITFTFTPLFRENT